MFHVEKQGAVDVVSCGVPLNREQVEDFRASVEKCLSAGQPMVILDLSQSPLVDSSGLECLVDLQDQVEHLGGTVKLASIPPLVQDALRATGVVERFETYQNVKSAIGSFAR